MTITDSPPRSDQYLDPPDNDLQEDEPLDLQTFRTLVTPQAPFPWDRTLERAHSQIQSPTQSWEGLCQSFCRKMPGCPGGAGTAFIQWTILSPEWKVPGDNFDMAPWGSTLFSIGDNPAGHVQLKDRPFSNGITRAVSTDALRVGKPDFVDPIALTNRWGQKRLGFALMMNGFALNVHEPQKPRSLPYLPVDKAIDALGAALDDLREAREKARSTGDKHDEEVFQRRIDHLRAFKKKMREDYKSLRHE